MSATDGYFAHGYGIKAMGGTSTAVPGDAMGGAMNPAKMVFRGTRLDVGVDLFLPRRSMAMAPFGAPDGQGFGWRNVNVLTFGASVNASRAITILGGYNHTDNPIRSTDVTINLVAPGVIEDHRTFGSARPSVFVGATPGATRQRTAIDEAPRA